MATKPTETKPVEIGAPVSGVLGGAGAAVDVVGRQGAMMTQTLTDLAMMSMVVNVAQQMGGLNRQPMEPGTTTVAAALGANADAYAKPGQFADTMLDNMLKFGVVTTLFQLANTNSGPTDEVKRQLQAEEDQKKAAIALDQAQKAEAIAEDDRKRVASFTAPKM
jgi:hypothetical protein